MYWASSAVKQALELSAPYFGTPLLWRRPFATLYPFGIKELYCYIKEISKSSISSNGTSEYRTSKRKFSLPYF